MKRLIRLMLVIFFLTLPIRAQTLHAEAQSLLLQELQHTTNVALVRLREEVRLGRTSVLVEPALHWAKARWSLRAAYLFTNVQSRMQKQALRLPSDFSTLEPCERAIMYAGLAVAIDLDNKATAEERQLIASSSMDDIQAGKLPQEQRPLAASVVSKLRDVILDHAENIARAFAGCPNALRSLKLGEPDSRDAHIQAQGLAAGLHFFARQYFDPIVANLKQ